MILTEEELQFHELCEDEDPNEDRELVIYQPSLLDYFQEDSQELDQSIVLADDPRWKDCLLLFKATKMFSLDQETYGAEPHHPLFFKLNRIRLIQVGLPNGLCMMADLGGWQEIDKPDYAQRIETTYNEFFTVLAEKLADPEVIVLGVNLKFDFTTIRHHFGFIATQARDLMIISQVLFAGVGVEKAKVGENRSERCKISHGFKGLAQRLGFEVDKTEQSSNWGWNLRNAQLNYAASDVTLLFPMFEKLKAMVIKAGLTYTAFVECNAVSVFSEMEYMGAPVDLELAQTMLSEYEDMRDKWVAEFEVLFPTVQWSSNVQVLQAFQESIPEFNTLFEDDEKPSVSAEILNKLKHPAAEALQQARILHTAVNNIKIYIDNSFDNHIRGFYRQIAPGGSGRSTCSAKMSVNRKSYSLGAQLQNPPNMIRRYKGQLKPVREIIKAPEGYSFGVFDGAQMHMRIAAELSQDPMLLRIFRDDFDGHSVLAAKLAEQAGKGWTAEFISGVLFKGPRDSEWDRAARAFYQKYKDQTNTFEQVLDIEPWIKSITGECKDYRNKAKTVLYSILNGSTAGRITQSMLSDGLKWFTYDHGKALVSYFNKIYPKLVKFIRDQHTKANETDADFSGFLTHDGQPVMGSWGKVKTMTGRHIYFKKYPSRFKPDKMEVSYTDATAANWLLPEADMIKHWAVEVLHEFYAHPEWGAYICNLVHDEINVVFKTKYADVIAPMIREKMEKVFGNWLRTIPPLEEADPMGFVCNNWSEK